MITSTWKIVDEALGVSGQFLISFPGDKDPDLNGNDELFFSAGEQEVVGFIGDSSVTREAKADTNETCQGADVAENGARNEYTEFHANDNKDHHVTEVVQLWTGLDYGVLETALTGIRPQGHAFASAQGNIWSPSLFLRGS